MLTWTKKLKDTSLRSLAAFSRKITPPDQWLRAIYSPDHRKFDFLETIIPYDNDLKIHIHTGSFFEWEIFFKGYYEKYVVQILKQYINPGNICLDIGANVGSDTLIMAKLTGPQGRVYAFEPNPNYFKRLKENLSLNHLDHVTPLMKAIDVSNGKAELFVATGPVKTASMVPFAEGYSQRQEIETITMDSALGDMPACHFIKIDVDGTEGLIIESCSKIIRKHRPVVLFEYCDEAWAMAKWPFNRTAQFFKDLNYTLSKVELNGTQTQLGEVPPFTNIIASPQP